MSEQQEQQQQSEDFAGYPDLDGLKNGYRASGGEAKKQRDRAELAERQLAQVLAANPHPAVPQRNDPYERLRDYGVPPEDLRAAIQQEVANGVQQALSPMTQGIKGRATLQVKYGDDYSTYEAKVAQHIAADPEREQRYNNMFQADPAGAMEWAFLDFGETERRSHKGGGGKREQREAAAEAQIPSSRGSGGRQQADPRQEQLEEAYNQFRKTGSRADAERYAKLRFRNVIKDDFLNQ